MEADLKISIKEPILPAGDYTIEQSVLIDEATGQIIAYRTIYYFFDKNTMEFQKYFSVFYFSDQNFKSDVVEYMNRVRVMDGKIMMDDFPEPTNVYLRMPHKRELVYMDNGVAIVIEVEAEAIQVDGIVDKERSLERYKQTEQQLIDIMKSII